MFPHVCNITLTSKPVFQYSQIPSVYVNCNIPLCLKILLPLVILNLQALSYHIQSSILDVFKQTFLLCKVVFVRFEVRYSVTESNEI